MVAFSGKSACWVYAHVGPRNQILAVGKLIRKKSERNRIDLRGRHVGISVGLEEIEISDIDQAVRKRRALAAGGTTKSRVEIDGHHQAARARFPDRNRADAGS